MTAEILAPAGNFDALVAAVRSGANAVYFGTGAFNARRNADNFDGDGLKRAVDFCHLHSVKCHITLNTLVSDSELSELENTPSDLRKRCGCRHSSGFGRCEDSKKHLSRVGNARFNPTFNRNA